MDYINKLSDQIVSLWHSAPALVQTMLAVIVTICLFYLIRFVLIRRLEKLTALTDNDFDDRLVHFLKQFLWLLAFFAGVVWILTINGIKVGPVLAGAGIFGIGIGLRRTTIRNTDGVIVNYPNSVLSASTIKNFSFEPSPVRARVRFQTDYTADSAIVKAITIQCIEQVEGVIAGSASVVIRSIWDDMQGHMLSKVLYEARYKLEDVKKRTPIR